ncbi:hypothetical protein NPIL_28601 [Nephila pilipes]|uniref:Reverse transcriptase/retrotransposon-derived protein RNase H-like domain-containing protein n=1 Tax=Nephila pilipes TaxID=299642 RepID=A0A8X6QYV4_NEPPI|nr:hypothetical protein NPIL_28601 [Nephila pilipes]
MEIFLELNFCLRFLRRGTHTQALLTEFLKVSERNEKHKIHWYDQTSAALKKSKQAITQAATLAHPTPNESLELQVDISDYAMSGARNINLFMIGNY